MTRSYDESEKLGSIRGEAKASFQKEASGVAKPKILTKAQPPDKVINHRMELIPTPKGTLRRTAEKDVRRTLGKIKNKQSQESTTGKTQPKYVPLSNQINESGGIGRKRRR